MFKYKLESKILEPLGIFFLCTCSVQVALWKAMGDNARVLRTTIFFYTV